MSDPNWTSPSGPAGDPGPGQPPPQQYVYAAIDPNQNWGVVVPPLPSFAILVPRPPRPPIVQLATILALVGVGLSLVLQVFSSIYQWTHRAEILDAVAGDEPMPPELRDATATGMTFGLVFGGAIWLVVAAGVVVCTLLTIKKKNPARIVLAVIMGVVGLYQLCQVGSGAVVLAASDRLTSAQGNLFASAQVTWWSMTSQVLLAVIALIVFVSLIIPPANRYFAPSPGHRFAPEV